jgi:hypothetical protein
MFPMQYHLLSVGLLFIIVSCSMARIEFGEGHLIYFDGEVFKEGNAGKNSILVRPGYSPVFASEISRPALLLSGMGGVVLFSYVKRVGGKHGGVEGVVAFHDSPVTISCQSGTFTGLTNADGFLLMDLPEGICRVAVTSGVSSDIEIRAGETTLLAIQAGKRMVD